MTGDFRQVGVIAKNEIIKSVRGRKFLISVGIMLIVFALITLLQTVSQNGWSGINEVGILSDYISSFSMVILLSVALISSVALVSEFEERTALILFTRPVRRTSILIGKMLACLVIETLIIMVYYILVVAVSLIAVGTVSKYMLASFLMCVIYAFAASGIAFMISAFFKKGSVCTIISLLVLLVMIPIFTAMIGGDTWYMLDTAGNSIITCVPEYVDSYNEGLSQFKEVVDSAAQILGGFCSEDIAAATESINQFVAAGGISTLPIDVQQGIYTMLGFMNSVPSEYLPDMITVLKYMTTSSLLAPIENPDLVKEALILFAWGLAGYFIAWIRFVRREF